MEEQPRPVPIRRVSKINTHRNSPWWFLVLYGVIPAPLA